MERQGGNDIFFEDLKVLQLITRRYTFWKTNSTSSYPPVTALGLGIFDYLKTIFHIYTITNTVNPSKANEFNDFNNAFQYIMSHKLEFIEGSNLIIQMKEKIQSINLIYEFSHLLLTLRPAQVINGGSVTPTEADATTTLTNKAGSSHNNGVIVRVKQGSVKVERFFIAQTVHSEYQQTEPNNKTLFVVNGDESDLLFHGASLRFDYCTSSKPILDSSTQQYKMILPYVYIICGMCEIMNSQMKDIVYDCYSAIQVVETVQSKTYSNKFFSSLILINNTFSNIVFDTPEDTRPHTFSVIDANLLPGSAVNIHTCTFTKCKISSDGLQVNHPQPLAGCCIIKKSSFTLNTYVNKQMNADIINPPKNPTLQISETKFINNFGQYSGAIYIELPLPDSVSISSFLIRQCAFIENSATLQLYFDPSDSDHITDDAYQLNKIIKPQTSGGQNNFKYAAAGSIYINNADNSQYINKKIMFECHGKMKQDNYWPLFTTSQRSSEQNSINSSKELSKLLREIVSDDQKRFKREQNTLSPILTCAGNADDYETPKEVGVQQKLKTLDYTYQQMKQIQDYNSQQSDVSLKINRIQITLSRYIHEMSNNIDVQDYSLRIIGDQNLLTILQINLTYFEPDGTQDGYYKNEQQYLGDIYDTGKQEEIKKMQKNEDEYEGNGITDVMTSINNITGKGFEK
ncbi:MAG: hypothetical protein EZS28_011836 [Streblomastix strix]|uniref:Uncharacterized protein n=1 Tax=Streblomastix strix TaxID=222440 RepID=A0A5J4WDX7_9EUKA|nr:MAG: hypothetical protein EZS28_011836 [Streblomastix strix]